MVRCDNVPSGQDGIDQDQPCNLEEARMALIWGHKLYRNGVLVLTPTPSLALACQYSSIKNKFRKNRG